MVAQVGPVAEAHLDRWVVHVATMPPATDSPLQLAGSSTADRHGGMAGQYDGYRHGGPAKEVVVNAFSLVATIAVLVAVAVFILLFERKRAKGIEADLRDQARRRTGDGGDPGGAQDRS